VRFPNIVTGKVQWLTVGYIPFIKADSEDADEIHRVRMLRDEVLQRCLAVLLDGVVTASAEGKVWDLPHIGPVLAVPRIILYAADQPEERHLLGLKLSGCKFQCSHCMVGKAEAGCADSHSCRREVLDNVELQLHAAKHRENGASRAFLEQFAAETSIVAIVPALAAVHGLGTGSLALYDIFGFDMLHVRFLLTGCSLHGARLIVTRVHWLEIGDIATSSGGGTRRTRF